MKFNVFNQKRSRGGELCEKFEDKSWSMVYTEKGVSKTLNMYSVDNLNQPERNNLYAGNSFTKIMETGKDILGELVLKNGEPDYNEIKSLLPQIQDGAFAFLSGALSWNGVTVSATNGAVYPQRRGINQEPPSLFSPTEIDLNLGSIKPLLFLLDGKLPILFSVHQNNSDILELMYFVEPGDPDRDPIVWIRSKQYSKSAPENHAITYRIVALSRNVPFNETTENLFLEALCNTVGYWLKFSEKGAKFDIPEKELERVVEGSQISCATTFSGDHPHYGHKYYGEEIHDNFPPNYLWSIEMCCLMGREAWGKRIWEHMLEYALSDEGRFCYRQGEQELWAASAGDYSCLLYLAWRYQKLLGISTWTYDNWEKIIGMGDIVLEHCRECADFGNKYLVYMCAEADTNTRLHAYLNNNLWAIRGFDALADLLKSNNKLNDAERFSTASKKILQSVNELLKEESVFDQRFGLIPPFRFGYTATPATLSGICRETFATMSDSEFAKYQDYSYMRDQGSSQDLTENTFANYRYYPEILSSMLLPDNQAEAIVKLREAIGGEILGMTRLFERIDNWPITHYARHLLETGNIDKYIMLLYAHVCHHGRPDLMCYYEQVTTDGKVIYYDCVPSLLTPPIMVAWMFAYETIRENKLVLLSGVPLDWLEKGCSAKKLGTSFGKLSITVKNNQITVDFDKPLETEAEITWRLNKNLTEKDIVSGMEFISKIKDNRIVLKKGITAANIKINKI